MMPIWYREMPTRGGRNEDRSRRLVEGVMDGGGCAWNPSMQDSVLNMVRYCPNTLFLPNPPSRLIFMCTAHLYDTLTRTVSDDDASIRQGAAHLAALPDAIQNFFRIYSSQNLLCEKRRQRRSAWFRFQFASTKLRRGSLETKQEKGYER